MLGLLIFVVFGPLLNLASGLSPRNGIFRTSCRTSTASASGPGSSRRAAMPLSRSATASPSRRLTVVLSTLIAMPAAYAIGRLRLPFRGLILLAFLLPQAFPNLPVYINVARIFYTIGLNGTMLGVVLVHTMHALVFSVWIGSAAFAAIDRSLEEAARNIGAGPFRCFLTVTLPLATPGIMASAIFVFLELLDEFTGTYFVGVPDIVTLPLLMFNASMGGNYQIASITALILLLPSILFMLAIERFLRADVLAKVGT